MSQTHNTEDNWRAKKGKEGNSSVLRSSNQAWGSDKKAVTDQNWSQKDQQKVMFQSIKEANEVYSAYNNEIMRKTSVTSKKKKFKVTSKKPSVTVTKMGYFMETNNVKSKRQQLELENKKLRIQFEKIRKKNMEQSQKANLEVNSEESSDENDEGEKYADKVAEMKASINEIKYVLSVRNRELEDLKMVKKEISQSEFIEKINYVEADLKQYREQAIRLMKKYKGRNENEGVDEEKSNKYKYNNIVLREYEELSNEMNQKLKYVLSKKLKKEEELQGKFLKKQRIGQNINDQEGEINSLDQEIGRLEEVKKSRSQFDKEKYKEIESKRRNLEDDLKNLEKKKKDLEIECNQVQTNLNEKFNLQKKEKEKKAKELEQLRARNNPDNEERSMDAEEEASEAEIENDENSEEYQENLRVVLSSHIQESIETLERKLILKRVS